MSQTPDNASIWLPDAISTQFSGSSLCKTIYTYPITLLLSGELGAGKTTFLQGFAQGLGITQPVTSPTFALEQRYDLKNSELGMRDAECIHIDLYRLNSSQSRDLLASTEDFKGIRCIEWPENTGIGFAPPSIHIHLQEKGPISNSEFRIPHSSQNGRNLHVSFDDALLPSRADIEQWRRDMLLPSHIQEHCDAVATFAEKLGEVLLRSGTLLRPMLLRRSAEVHDLLRFLDFRPGGFHESQGPSKEESARWEEIRAQFPDLKHEPACAAFLREKGLPVVADVVAVHGLTLPAPTRSTIEQKLLYYSDKRVRITDVVTLEERFADFQKRYGGDRQTPEGRVWFEEAKEVEKELFPDGVPF